MTLYIDLVFLENVIMNYIIILATGIICRCNIKQFRMILSSIVGGLYAIVSYVVDLSIYNNQITKILLSICMVYLAFDAQNIKKLLKHLTIFYLTSFCFGGAAYYLLYCVKPDLIKSVDGILTGTYPIKIAILGGILGFIILNISFRIIKNKLSKNDLIYKVEIFYKEKITKINVVLDTGNFLTDPITSIPVIIVEKECLKNIISEDILNNIDEILYNNFLDNVNEEIKRRCCIIPFSSIGNENGIIIGFRPDYINIFIENEEIIKRKVIIGICKNKISKNGAYSGLIGLNLLNQPNNLLNSLK